MSQTTERNTNRKSCMQSPINHRGAKHIDSRSVYGSLSSRKLSIQLPIKKLAVNSDGYRLRVSLGSIDKITVSYAKTQNL